MDLRDKVSIGVCSPGQWSALFATSMIDIARSQSQLGQLISLEGSGVISRLRNQVVATFLEKTTDEWLLQIDTDQIITVDAFKKLIKAADKDERPIVSGVVHAGWSQAKYIQSQCRVSLRWAQMVKACMRCTIIPKIV